MNNEQITSLYENFNGERESKKDQLESWWSSWAFSCRDNIVSGFLIPHLLTLGTNHKCKLCQNKIHDKYKITTREPYSPIYHVHCYRQLHELLLAKFDQFSLVEIEKVPSGERTELTNIPISE